MHTIYLKNINEVKKWLFNCGFLTNHVLFMRQDQIPIASWIVGDDEKGVLTTRFDIVKNRNIPKMINFDNSSYDILRRSVESNISR